MRIEYLHTATNSIYFKDYEISEQELYEFQSSDKPETLGFKFDRKFEYINEEENS